MPETMRFALLADIHGNRPALEAVLNDLTDTALTGIWVLGDTVGGPGQNTVMDRLHALGAVVICGNNEHYLRDYHATHTAHRRVGKQWALMRWVYHNLEPRWLDMLTDLPDQLTLTWPHVPSARLVHGSPRHVREPLIADHDPHCVRIFEEAGFFADSNKPVSADIILCQMDETVLACGHTHVQWQQQLGGKLGLNPGSVGGPFGGDPRARYALLIWDGDWQVERRTVAYDLDQFDRDMEQSGFLAETGALGQAMQLSSRTGQSVMYALVLHARRLAEQAGLSEMDNLPDEIWNGAVATFDWSHAASGLPMF